jgi:hypothetical protein
VNVLDVKQGSEAWLAARRGLPTASRFDQILTPVTMKPSSSQTKLIDELIAEALIPDAPATRITEDMRAGMVLEAEARCAYELGNATAPVKEVGFVLAECGMFGGSPDALVGEDGGAEIKCPNATTHIGYIRAGVLPADYRCQVHGYLVVTGRKFWDFFSYHRGLDPFCVRVEPDEFTAKLAAELTRFCAIYNEARAKFNLPKLPIL